MRVNRETVLVGSKVVLVPYRKEHVPTYHEWMKDPIIQEQTASEPLSLEEEYEMQRSWAEDTDKLTFIILARGDASSSGKVEDMVANSKMVGDVNIFFNEAVADDDDDDDDDDDGRVENGTGQNLARTVTEYDAECEIMIADREHRRGGLAREALRLMIHYVTGKPTPSATGNVPASQLPIPLNWLTCKISLTNEPSIRLFEGLGFEKVKVSEVWQEVEMRYKQAPAEAGESAFANSLVEVLHWPVNE